MWPVRSALTGSASSTLPSSASRGSLRLSQAMTWAPLASRLSTAVSPDRARTFKAFEQYVLHEKPPEDVAKALGMSVDGVHQAKHRVTKALREALAVIGELRPRRAFLTHLDHELRHAALAARLPAGVEVAEDGLELRIPR